MQCSFGKDTENFVTNHMQFYQTLSECIITTKFYFQKYKCFNEYRTHYLSDNNNKNNNYYNGKNADENH